MLMANNTQGDQALGLDPVASLQRKLYRAAKQCRSRRFHALFDKVHRRDFLWRAWVEVARNGGAPGIDGVTIEAIEEGGVDGFIDQLAAELAADRYRPLPVRRVSIPKRTGGKRHLGVPAVRDRVVQAAAKAVLEPIFEADFAPVSFGFRPKRSAHQARERIRDQMRRGYRWAVDADIAGFFDHLDHDLLLAMVAERVSDRRVRDLVAGWLRSGVLDGVSLIHPDAGTPQGGVISPLLANIYLHRLDKAWRDSGGVGVLVRYCDDRVTRTKRRNRCRRSRPTIRCCVRDGGMALRDRPAGGGPKPPQAAAVKSRGGERCGKGGSEPVRCEPRRRAEANHPMTGRKRIDGIKNGVESLPRDEPGGYLPTAQAVPGLKVARARFRLWHGTCEPASRYRPAVHWTCGPPAGESETPKWQKPQGAE